MSPLILRGFSGLLYMALVVFCTLFHPTSFYLLFFVFMLLCLYEFAKMTSSSCFFAMFMGSLFFIAGNPMITYLLPFEILPKNLTYLVLLTFFGVFIFNLLSSERKSSIEKLGKLFANIIYIAIPFTLLCKIPWVGQHFFEEGKYIVLSVFIMIWVCDTFAFFTGKLIGKHKLFESVSPKKTIEGVVGGTLFTVISSMLIAKQFEVLSTSQWMVVSIIISFFGVLGDLIESMFKRQCNRKDSSNLIPGHGGFLDRLDSVIFATPFLYIYLELIH